MNFPYYFYSQYFTEEQCKNIRESLDRDKEIRSNDLAATGVIKTATVDQVRWSKAKNYLDSFQQLIDETNQLHFGFDIYRTTDLSGVNYNTYDSKTEGQYDWHCDGALHEPYDLKLTAILNISDEPYTGGEFELFLNGPKHIVQLEIPGSILIFPSFIRHRVKPVTSGIRKTVSIWMRGPNFK